MATITVCDKCKKRIPEDEHPWKNEQYQIDLESEKPEKIGDQVVQVHALIDLECGSSFEICDNCAWKILKKYLIKKGI